MPSAERPAALAPAALLLACRRVLRPLVRLLMRSGITFPVLADLLRTLFVEVALTDVLTDRKARTDSRISLLTGVHRKEIRRLRQHEAAAETVPPVVSLASQVIARWLGTPACLDAAGRPRPLPRLARAGEAGMSFEALVESVTTDVRARALLDAWVSEGVVTLDADDRVRLNTAAFIPRPGSTEQMFYFGRNLHDHVAAAAANVACGGAPPFIDRSVHYDRLDAPAAAALEAAARAAAQRALVEVNSVALALVADEPPCPAATRRVNFGVYLFVEDETAGQDAAP